MKRFVLYVLGLFSLFGIVSPGYCQVPPVPTGLTATPGSTTVALQWNASSGATKYRVEKSTNQFFSYSLVSEPTNTSLSCTGLNNGTQYWFRVRATNASGNSAYCTPVSATPRIPAPTNLSATTDHNNVNLSWDAVTGATSYKVFRSTTSGSEGSSVGTVSGTTYTDTGRAYGTTYYYVVKAQDNTNTSNASNQVSATPAIAAPVDLTATPDNQRILLAWQTVPGADDYQLRRATISGGPYTPVVTISANTYTDTGKTNGVTYYYVVVAIGDGQVSANSNQASATPVLLPPTGLTATPQNRQVSLSWTASPSISVDGYMVKRSTTSNGPYVELGMSGDTLYTDEGLVNNTTYYYVVTAVDGSQQSTNSNQASVTPFLSPPFNLTATPGNGQVGLSWTASPSISVDGYMVKRSTISNGPYVELGMSGDTLYTDESAVNNQLYFYVVTTVDGTQQSANSNQAAAEPIPLPAQVTGLTAIPGNRRATLSWNAVPTATQYKIKFSPSEGGTYTTIATINSTATAYIVTGMSNSEMDWFKVSAVNGSGEGNDSTKVSATPRLPAPVITGRPMDSAVEISWPAVEFATSYRLFRASSLNGNYNHFETIATTSHIDVDADNGETRYYYVKAVDETDVSDLSNKVSIIAQPPPPAPTSVIATAGSGQVSLSWTGSLGATSYNIWRSIAATGPYTKVGNTGNTITNYVDSYQITNGTSYYYVVSAVGVGESNNSAPPALATPFDGWSLSTGITCAGIRPLPLAPGQTTVAPGSAVRISAHLASDYDVRTETVNGVTTSRTLSDTCYYSWSSAAGSVENGLDTGPSIVWLAPTTPGLYTVYLTVDDQNSTNLGANEAGLRDDDPALQFSISIQVQ